jgi:hypothetical protein
MSRSLARLNSSTRSIQLVPSGSVLAPPRTAPGLPRRRRSDGRTVSTITHTAAQQDDHASETDEVLDSRFARHLNEQFSPLKFPPELARRILTHGSHRKAPIDGHNARLGFIGTCNYITEIIHSSKHLKFDSLWQVVVFSTPI